MPSSSMHAHSSWHWLTWVTWWSSRSSSRDSTVSTAVLTPFTAVTLLLPPLALALIVACDAMAALARSRVKSTAEALPAPVEEKAASVARSRELASCRDGLETRTGLRLTYTASKRQRPQQGQARVHPS